MEPLGTRLRHTCMKTLSRAGAALTLAAAALVLQAPGASALSCVHPSDWYPEAEHVFVGRVSDVAGDKIQVDVSEVWQGPDLADRIWMERDTSMDMWFPFSRDGEVPEGYSSPEEYVIAAQEDLVLGACSLAPLDGGGYGVPGADSPRPPAAAGESDDATVVETGVAPPPERSSAAPLAAGGAGVVGAGALAALLWRRRRSS